MTLDVFRWLVIRTDRSGAALSMIVKQGIVVLEWITRGATPGPRRPETVRRSD